MVITGEEFSMTGEAIASPVNMLKYALLVATQVIEVGRKTQFLSKIFFLE